MEHVEDQDSVIEAGRVAWRSLKNNESFEHWIAVGLALARGRQLAMRDARTNEPTGARYSRLMGAWIAENGFEDLEKTTRSRLLNVIDNLDAIRRWRQTLGLGVQLRQNHPVVVWREWEKLRKEPLGPEPSREAKEIHRLRADLATAQNALAEYRAENQELKAENDRLRDELKFAEAAPAKRARKAKEVA